MKKIGFMQGRLSPKPADRIQAFPKDSWQQEFTTGKKVGFDCIEIIFDTLHIEANPLITKNGRKILKNLVDDTGLEINSICADYFMVEKLAADSITDQEKNLAVALDLLDWSAEINCPIVEFPFVDSSSLKNPLTQKIVAEKIKIIANKALSLNLKIALETDLPPIDFKVFLSQFPAHVGANFDMGNSAALGYDALAECQAFGDRILNVHIKDRILGGTTVPLTTGNTDFKRAFSGLKKCGYAGDYILQTAPDPDYVGVAVKYKNFVKDYLTTN